LRGFAATDRVLILSTTISGGLNSTEANEATSKGFAVDIVDPTAWTALTPAQFSSYRAIILGDPTCSGNPSTVAAATSTATTWEPLLNGNVIIVGTDPVLHQVYGSNRAGAEKLTRDAVDFAVAQPGKTGAYISLSCYYDGRPAHTPVPLLDGIEKGGFTVTGVSCQDSGHIVAVSPAIVGLTDADLQSWGCSVHEAFDKFSGSFAVLAIDKDHASTFTASDGTTGAPYILASGDVKSFPLSVSPLSGTVSPGSSYTVTAQLLDVNTRAPVAGQLIGFKVIAGPDTGATGVCSPDPTCTTGASGTVAWTFTTGRQAGDDTIQAFVDLNRNGIADVGEPQTTAGLRITGDAIKDAVFVHGWHSNAHEVQKGNAYAPLMKALLNKLPDHVTALTYYQDLAYATPNGTCNPMPTPDTNTQNLHIEPNAANPNLCDSKSDLGYNAAFLDDAIQTKTGPVAVISNSLGGGIVRGWMVLAQQRASDPSLNLATTVIFTQGTQQGVFWTNLDQQSKASFGAPGQAIFRWAANAIGYDLTRPSAQDVYPQGPWYQSVNPVPVPPQLHYYNFYSDVKVHYVQYFFGWKTADLGTDDYGDTALLPGDPDPSKMPKGGGARFLPGLTPVADRHEFAYNHTYDSVVTSDGDGTSGLGMASQAFAFVTGDPAIHPKYIDNGANGAFTVDSCTGQGPVTPVAKILYILDHPSAGCSP
jgi:hypothetical protein